VPAHRSARVLVALAASVVVLAAAGCSKSVPPQDEYVKALVTSGVPAAEARCTARAAYRILSKSELKDLIDRGSSGVPKNDPDNSTDHADRLAIAMGKCHDQAASHEPTGGPIDGTTSPTTTTTVVPSTSGASINTTAPTAPADGT
jgi:hypothetical protein